MGNINNNCYSYDELISMAYNMKEPLDSRFMEVLYNNDYGGYGFSDAILEKFKDKKEILKDRTNKELINAVKKLGLKESSGRFCSLDIAIIPCCYNYRIVSSDGIETIELIPKVEVVKDLLQFFSSEEVIDYLDACGTFNCTPKYF